MKYLEIKLNKYVHYLFTEACRLLQTLAETNFQKI